ncbi:MAG TPA: enoyl-CoA hydratase/isomerase family protein [Alphaproteobacteria bacterium]|jgi:enoyl-CoA hydratase|nr:enoyl-CoA hydratase/isomerase family protein [Alphaproteobacteria bacterium]MDP6269417.1 enoyl-CoA hydratase/isomerase family protein [Alphaproteobacteria bacterium]MDP7427584.1 enoyl-CoA hydratase/isomerase family protein [Alphaproteobacteria bacterium]HJM51981.1 enoyl-CoA hydratase/isomerase family protein [Alphaproteobacteria bacterium]|tara:strand:- start:1169 stop:1843 length:675 start_codon:yes stop_codon:yes gene_type:complete
MPNYIDLARDGAIATITLDRADKKNAQSIALRDELSEAFAELGADEDLKAVILTGNGNVFCAGFDLDEFERARQDEEFHDHLWQSGDRFLKAHLEFPLPLIAALNGPAIAGGFDLAVMCDIRIATPSVFFAHPEIAFGDVTYGPLHDIVGGAIARELCLTGRRVDAEEALEMHLVSRIVEPGELMAEARLTAEMIAAAPRWVTLRTKAKAQARAAVEFGDTADL